MKGRSEVRTSWLKGIPSTLAVSCLAAHFEEEDKSQESEDDDTGCDGGLDDLAGTVDVVDVAWRGRGRCGRGGSRGHGMQ